MFAREFTQAQGQGERNNCFPKSFLIEFKDFCVIENMNLLIKLFLVQCK